MIIRKSSSESNKKTSRRSSHDSEISFEETADHVRRASNLSSYAEYTESDCENDLVDSDEIDGSNKENFKSEVSYREN